MTDQPRAPRTIPSIRPNPGTPYCFLAFFDRPGLPGRSFRPSWGSSFSTNGRPPSRRPVLSWRRIAAARLDQKRQIRPVVVPAEERRHATVSDLRNMVWHPGNHHSCQSCHGATIHPRSTCVKKTPYGVPGFTCVPARVLWRSRLPKAANDRPR